MEPTTSAEEYFIKAIQLLHSSSKNSAKEIRKLLDSEITKQYGSFYTLEKKLSKIQMESLLEQESQILGSERMILKQPQKPKFSEKTAQEKLEIEDIGSSIASALINELSCQVCHQMDSTALNPLLECVGCSSLFHHGCFSQDKVSKDSKKLLCRSCNPEGIIVKRTDTMKVDRKIL